MDTCAQLIRDPRFTTELYGLRAQPWRHRRPWPPCCRLHRSTGVHRRVVDQDAFLQGTNARGQQLRIPILQHHKARCQACEVHVSRAAAVRRPVHVARTKGHSSWSCEQNTFCANGCRRAGFGADGATAHHRQQPKVPEERRCLRMWTTGPATIHRPLPCFRLQEPRVPKSRELRSLGAGTEASIPRRQQQPRHGRLQTPSPRGAGGKEGADQVLSGDCLGCQDLHFACATEAGSATFPMLHAAVWKLIRAATAQANRPALVPVAGHTRNQQTSTKRELPSGAVDTLQLRSGILHLDP
mmetsp:Transcript_68633/g.151103  ORF Transcript_68633/g.151103 Transcript_68633/m.151103 type:complete len:298 (+) Transcript_68633:2495-3388(+)